jgi:hypothetical protein
MDILLKLIILALVFIFGMVCIRAPFQIARLIVKWTRFALGNYPGKIDPKLLEAIFLMDNNPREYENKFKMQLEIISLTGWVALMVSCLGI